MLQPEFTTRSIHRTLYLRPTLSPRPDLHLRTSPRLHQDLHLRPSIEDFFITSWSLFCNLAINNY